MKKIKTAAILAAAMITLTACGANTRFAGTVDGEDIPAGVYIYQEMTAFYDAYSLQSEEDMTAGTPLLDSVIEDIPARQWIADETLKKLREYAAINKKFADLGLDYTTDEYGMTMDDVVDESIDYSWDSNIAPTLMPYGISKESYRQVQLNAVKRDQLFEYYYGPGGEKEVPEAEIKKYLTDNFAHIDYFEMPLKDAEGNLLKSDGKAERMAMAEDYIARAKGGEDFNDIMKQYEDWYTDLTTPDENAIQAGDTAVAADPAASPEDEVPPTNAMFIKKGDAYPSAEIDTKVFEYQSQYPDFTESQYIIVEAENGERYWVVKIMPLLEDPTYYEDTRLSAFYELKSVEFIVLIDIWTRDQQLILNEKAVERYAPDMFVATE
jgi:hypothetical protein